MPLNKTQRDAALDKLELQFKAYVLAERERLTTEYDFLQAIRGVLSIENSAARRSREVDKAKALISVGQLLPSLTI